MSRSTVDCLVVTALVLAASLASGATYEVGTCLPKLPHFPTITQAVNTVPAGSIIKICPGTYPEQLLIQKSLNLQGVVSANSTGPVITVPQPSPTSPGLVVNVVSQETAVFFTKNFPFAAQVLVQSPTPVFLSDLTIDGTGGNMGCSTTNIWLAGIFYTGGTSGNINHITTRNQFDQGCGVGIWVEDTAGPGQSVTIQNSSVHDFDYSGIFAGTAGTDSWLTATIKNNFVFQGGGSSPNGSAGITSAFVTGAVMGNVVTGVVDTGIFNLSSFPLTTVSNNVVGDSATGIATGFDGGTIFHNQISNVGIGIDLQSNNATVNGNGVTNSVTGIEFECNTGQVFSNTINDATTAEDNVPFGFALLDHYYNVDNVSTQCPFGASVKGIKSRHIHIPGLPVTK